MINENIKQAYSANIDLQFENNGNRIRIQQEKIVYVMIEHDYESQVLPIIYICISVDSDLYTDIINYKDSAKFYLKIEKKNKFSNISLSRETLSDSFNYIPSSTNPNYTQELGDEPGKSFKRIVIGLVSVGLTNKLRKSFNGVYNNIDTNTLLGVALEGTNCIIEKPKYNHYFDSFLVTPLSSRYKLIEYIFNKDPFYNTNFRYFMDFKQSYLLSKEGNSIDAGDGDLSNVLVDIKSLTENEAYYDGISIRNNSYYVYINPSNARVITDDGTKKIANKIVAIDEDKVEESYLNSNIYENDSIIYKEMYIRTDNASLYKNEFDNTVFVEILKQHIDGSIFTPNKCILVNNYGNYSKFNGKYLIMYKKEFYKCIAGEFVMSCIVGLKRIGKIESLNRIEKRKKQSGIVSKSAFTYSSNDKYNESLKAGGINGVRSINTNTNSLNNLSIRN